MKRRTFIKIGLGTTALAAVPFQACRGVEPEDRRPENMHLDFSACPHCNAQRFEHHKSYYCPRAAIPAGEEEIYKSIQKNLNEILLRHGSGLYCILDRPDQYVFEVILVWYAVYT